MFWNKNIQTLQREWENLQNESTFAKGKVK
jgi:hypothetical protein